VLLQQQGRRQQQQELLLLLLLLLAGAVAADTAAQGAASVEYLSNATNEHTVCAQGQNAPVSCTLDLRLQVEFIAKTSQLAH
jgi:hypothetical protein